MIYIFSSLFFFFLLRSKRKLYENIWRKQNGGERMRVIERVISIYSDFLFWEENNIWLRGNRISMHYLPFVFIFFHLLFVFLSILSSFFSHFLFFHYPADIFIYFSLLLFSSFFLLYLFFYSHCFSSLSLFRWVFAIFFFLSK